MIFNLILKTVKSRFDGGIDIGPEPQPSLKHQRYDSGFTRTTPGPQQEDTIQFPSLVRRRGPTGPSVVAPAIAIGRATQRFKFQVSTSTLHRKSADIRLVGRHSEVYEPCDDSFALVDALLADWIHLEEAQPSLCLEIGCGSGYVITSLALMLGQETGIQYLATDISSAATEVTHKTLAAHGVHADVILADLASGLDKHLAGTVDVLVVNPPYVPTSEEEVGGDGVAAAWAGGKNGRTVIDRILALVDNLLSNKGCFYLITLTANNPSEICLIMKRKGFASRIIVQSSTEEESLHVLKFWRDPSEITTDTGTSPPQSLTRRLSRLAFWKNN